MQQIDKHICYTKTKFLFLTRSTNIFATKLPSSGVNQNQFGCTPNYGNLVAGTCVECVKSKSFMLVYQICFSTSVLSVLFLRISDNNNIILQLILIYFYELFWIFLISLEMYKHHKNSDLILVPNLRGIISE